MKREFKLLTLLKLDLTTLPCHIMDKKSRANWHLKNTCPRCPTWRQKMRDVKKTGECWWREEWSKANYNIDTHFGALNWIKQYLGKKTDLSKWQTHD